MTKQRTTTLTMLLIMALHLAAHSLLVEAERFQNKGGWVVDAQFIEQMGSPYLLAHGMGTPVKMAETPVNVPAAATYFVYVRTYNWTSPWHKGRGPGRFFVGVNGRKLGQMVGDAGDSWQWQYAGKAQLKQGINRLSLHDATGFDGRCDAIYLSTTPNPPPHAPQTLATWREKQHPSPIQEASTTPFDLVVVGGGVAGMSAALAAARLGLRVALVQNRPVLGGNNSSEVRVHLGGRINMEPYPRLGDLQKEFAPTQEGNAMPAENYADARKLAVVKAEKNISLYLNFHVDRVEMAPASPTNNEGNCIKAVVAQQVETGQRLRFSAPLFADCTGDGTVGFLAGAHYCMGREAQSAFHEDLAPQQADSMTLGVSMQWRAEKRNKAVPFAHFDYGIGINRHTCEPVFKGEWTWETGLWRHKINEIEAIRDYGLAVIYANWSFLKHAYQGRKSYEKWRLAWVGYVAGKRESRRLLGDYVLSEQDIMRNMPHEDATFTTTWSLDLHYPDSLQQQIFPFSAFKAVSHQRVIYPYAVPFRCLYSRNVNNLFMAGRNISVTHVALGSTRVMRTTGMMGEVVGMAAAVCKANHALPRQVYQLFFGQLRQLMLQGVGHSALPNNQHYNEGWVLSEPPALNSRPIDQKQHQ